jgi:hypothetical protein
VKTSDAEPHERFEKLETKIGELSILVDILLDRSGLDMAGIERAHDYAEKTWKEIVETLAKRASDDFLATPEGQQVQQEILEQRGQRARQFWRGDSKEAGRIFPDPSARKGDT